MIIVVVSALLVGLPLAAACLYRKKPERLLVVLASLLPGLLMGLFLPFCVRDILRAKTFLKPELLRDVHGTHRELLNADWRLPGKVVVFTRDGRVDSLTFELPDDLRARSPQEVRAIVVLDCGTRKAGEYSDGAIASERYCNVDIIDRTDSTIRFSTTMVGTAPPEMYGKSLLPGGGSGPRVGDARSKTVFIDVLRHFQPGSRI